MDMSLYLEPHLNVCQLFQAETSLPFKFRRNTFTSFFVILLTRGKHNFLGGGMFQLCRSHQLYEAFLISFSCVCVDFTVHCSFWFSLAAHVTSHHDKLRWRHAWTPWSDALQHLASLYPKFWELRTKQNGDCPFKRLLQWTSPQSKLGKKTH